MKTTDSSTACFQHKWAVVLLALTLFADGAAAAERFRIPEEAPGVPAYARELDSPHSEWVVYVFYRSLDCVPLNFNFVDFFDFELLDPTEDCQILMQGFEIWEDPETSFAPFQNELHEVEGVPIPILFVRRTEWLEAVDDGKLTFRDLLRFDSLLVGMADSYHEILQPEGANKNPELNVTASGVLEDGRTFDVFVEANWPGDTAVFSVFNQIVRFD